MSDPIWLGLEYDAAYERANLRTVIEVVRSAVAENWADNITELSPPGPLSPVDVEGWLVEAAPKRMDDTSASPRPRPLESWYFSYSPTSAWVAELVTSRWKDGTLNAWTWISHNALIESLNDFIRKREENPDFRPPWPDEDDPDYLAWWERFYATHREAWQVNRDCLLHLFDRLRRALPVRNAKLDDRLLKGLDPATSEYARFVRV